MVASVADADIAVLVLTASDEDGDNVAAADFSGTAVVA